jgi:hypothetical protein
MAATLMSACDTCCPCRFIANPDLPNRIKHGHALNVYDRATFYTATIDGGDTSVGYVDYPDVAGTVGETGKYDMMEQGDIGATLASAKKQTAARL